MVKDLTKGSIPKHLITFAIPIILGNLFQLTYNAVDSIVVGKYSGTNSLAAVGTANPVMNIVILGVTGICIGASVLMSQFFGAGDKEKLKKEVATTLVFGGIFSVVMVILGLAFSRTILRLMKTPEEILDIAAVYLRIIFLGMPFTYLYNAMASAMRSVGDSKTPIQFLAASSVLNIALDCLFVAVFHWEAVGAGAATVLSQAVSALLCVWYVYRKIPLLQLRREDLKMDGELLKLTLQHGSITALQQSCQPVGKLLIQGKINTLGISAMAAFNAVNRVDDFAFTPEQSISHAMMTFIAQNRGAKQMERVKKGFRDGLLVEFSYWILICAVILLFRKPIMGLFSSGDNPGMLELGVDYLGLMAFFYLLPAFTNGVQGFFRGMGNMKITLISTIIQISVRVVFVYILVPSMGMTGVAFASLIGWVCMLAAEIPYYFVYMKKAEKSGGVL